MFEFAKDACFVFLFVFMSLNSCYRLFLHRCFGLDNRQLCPALLCSSHADMKALPQLAVCTQPFINVSMCMRISVFVLNELPELLETQDKHVCHLRFWTIFQNIATMGSNVTPCNDKIIQLTKNTKS
ncbi:hypothetical protein ILYODFUR_002828 [Ilyodon furcidens]|uniref:Secreted protein n=1 Tax=Ilyodon furcidens TaxID=33524 RepID=A0ABV0UCV7_9TELE